jgi:hypothetical protein
MWNDNVMAEWINESAEAINGMIVRGENRSSRRTSCPSATLTFTSVTDADLVSNPFRRDERQATDRWAIEQPSYGCESGPVYQILCFRPCMVLLSPPMGTACKVWNLYFIIQLSVVSYCRLVYRINVAHSKDRPHTQCTGGKWETAVVS